MLTVDECTVRPYLQSFSFDPLGIKSFRLSLNLNLFRWALFWFNLF